MKINIDAPIKQNEIVETLKNCPALEFTYLGHPNNMRNQVQFEADETKVGGNLIAWTKAYIKKQMGNMVVFRVLEDGKNW